MFTDRNKLESPIEEIFIQQFEKWTAENYEIIPQYEIETPNGKFRIDFVIVYDDKKIGIELDGKEFHDEWHDEWRDAILLGNEKLNVIYRLRGKDITTYINECIYIIYLNDKKIFNERYLKVCKSLVETEILENPNTVFKFREDNNFYTIEITNQFGEKTGRHHQIKIIRRMLDDKEQYWNKLFEFACKYPNHNIEQLINLRKEIQRNACR